MEYLKITLRLIHIFSGVLWIGGSLAFVFFIQPTAMATADAGQKFMGHLMGKTRMSVILSVAAILTVVAGFWLYFIDANGVFDSGWATSAAGMGFGIGGIFGLIALIFGMLIGNYSAKLGRISVQAQGKPTPEQISQISAIQSKMKYVVPISMISQIVSVICMATARYWGLM